MEKGKIYISLLGKVKQNENTECMTLNKIANIKNHHPHVYFINNKNGSLVFNLWKGG